MKKLLALVGLTVLGGSLGFLAAGCGSEKAVSLGRPAQTGSTAVTEPTGTVPTSVSLEAWFLRGEQLVRELRTHEATPLVATAALRALLAGPTPAELESGLGTAIPAGTRLLGIAIKKGVATVDLTSDYQSGGGSLSMQARLGQVVYTLTQFPTVRRVRFHLDGEPVNVFSGEGIVLDHPVGRKDYEDLLPVIVVESPVEGARVTSPLSVSGSANVFEANVTVKVLDENEHVLGKTFTTATCGTGCRGTYSVPVRFDVGREQRGTIVVSDDDAAGTGTPPHVVRVPVVLVPRR
jgi:sporulation and spore germination protein/immunoglobulin-like protein involved in spore germination